MKRMLCALVLLITMSTGLLVGKSASADMFMITDHWEEIQNSEWKGWWDPTGGTGGRAELHLVRIGYSTVIRAKLSIYGSLRGDFTRWRQGKDTET